MEKKNEKIVRDLMSRNTRYEFPVFEKRKGKEFHASGEWKTSEHEQKIIERLGKTAMAGIFLGLLLLFVFGGLPAMVVLGAGIAAFIAVFVYLIYLVIQKNRKQPIETHYYRIDEQRNQITGSGYNHSEEITKEEFHRK